MGGIIIQYKERLIHNRDNITEIIIGIVLLFGLYIISTHNFLLFHGIAEIVGIVVACSIFIIIWHARKFIDNNYFMVISIGYLFIAILSIFHTLAYKGMGVFTGYDANLPTQLWIASRYMEGITFFIAPLLLGKKINTNYIFSGYAIVTSILLASIFYWDIFPDCFIEGSGLTTFKIVSEYIISLLLLCSIYLLYQKKHEFDTDVVYLIVAALIASIFAELAFTFYISVYDFSNLMGHVLKIVSVYLIYKAIIEKSLTNPNDILFRSLKESEQSLLETKNYLTELIEHANAPFIVWDTKLEITKINHAFEHLSGYLEAELLHKKIDMLLPEATKQESLQKIEHTPSDEYWESVEMPILCKDGTVRLVLWNSAKLFEEEEEVTVSATIAQGIDITERKQVEEALRKNESILNETQHLTKVGGWEYDVEKKTFIWSDEVYRIHGVTPEDYDINNITKSIQFYSSQDRETIERAFTDAVEEGKSYDLQLKFTNTHGEQLWVRTIGQAEIDDGRVVRVYGNIMDITPQKQAEEKLKLSEEKYRLMFENMFNGFAYHKIVKDNEGTPIDYIILEMNDSFERMTGLKRKDVIDKHITVALPGIENDPSDWIGRYGKVAIQGNNIQFESFSEPLNRWYSVYAYCPQQDHFVTIVEDITERKQADDELHKLNAELEQRVLERTAELKEKNKKLQIMLDGFVGRELRMVELKKQIAEFEKEIEKYK